MFINHNRSNMHSTIVTRRLRACNFCQKKKIRCIRSAADKDCERCAQEGFACTSVITQRIVPKKRRRKSAVTANPIEEVHACTPSLPAASLKSETIATEIMAPFPESGSSETLSLETTTLDNDVWKTFHETALDGEHDRLDSLDRKRKFGSFIRVFKLTQA
ncbi:hypothetical protein EJ07DRAFT_158851 [Lizonia empirigonia]|nr:hypothetical protein EJ07DRAFT_158851 [Lizonia empirigonia]